MEKVNEILRNISVDFSISLLSFLERSKISIYLYLPHFKIYSSHQNANRRSRNHWEPGPKMQIFISGLRFWDWIYGPILFLRSKFGYWRAVVPLLGKSNTEMRTKVSKKDSCSRLFPNCKYDRWCHCFEIIGPNVFLTAFSISIGLMQFPSLVVPTRSNETFYHSYHETNSM